MFYLRISRKISDDRGFSLLELVVVVLIVSVLATFAVLSYTRTSRLMRDSVTRTRLFQAAEAQAQFRTALGRRRYAALSELASTETPGGKLLPETVVKFDSAGNSLPIDNWVLETTPGASTDPGYLRYKFDIRIRPDNASAADKIYCIHEDAVEREGTYSAGCNRSSPAVER